MHLQPGERRTQLMRRIGEKSLLHRARLPHLRKQPIEGADDRGDFNRCRGLRQWLQITRLAPRELRAQMVERAQAAGNAEPRECDRRNGDQQRGDKLGDENLRDQLIPLVQRLADLHDVCRWRCGAPRS